jgi:hypothetical protein
MSKMMNFAAGVLFCILFLIVLPFIPIVLLIGAVCWIGEDIRNEGIG